MSVRSGGSRTAHERQKRELRATPSRPFAARRSSIASSRRRRSMVARFTCREKPRTLGCGRERRSRVARFARAHASRISPRTCAGSVLSWCISARAGNAPQSSHGVASQLTTAIWRATVASLGLVIAAAQLVLSATFALSATSAQVVGAKLVSQRVATDRDCASSACARPNCDSFRTFCTLGTCSRGGARRAASFKRLVAKI